jgi:hypothetical protein
MSTRPFRGGVAYPFSLRVEEEGRSVNGSMVTLESVGEGIVEPIPQVEGEKEVEQGYEGKGKEKEKVENGGKEKVERPEMERFVTADVGDMMSAKTTDVRGNLHTEEKMERPGVERFETAQEVLVDGKKE